MKFRLCTTASAATPTANAAGARPSAGKRWLVAAAALLLCGRALAQEPGPAQADVRAAGGEVSNQAVKLGWKTGEGHVRDVVFADLLHHTTLSLPLPFAAISSKGQVYRPETLRLDGAPRRQRLRALPAASRESDRLAGEEVDVPLVSEDGNAHFTWSVVLRDGSRYVRQVLEIKAPGQDLPIQEVQLLDLKLPDARVVGDVSGSPIVAGDLFFGFEHPLSGATVREGRATEWIDRELPIRSGQSVQYSSVIGVAREGQLRRDFLTYIERERAHPYRTFLHYNSWYDIGYFSPYDQAAALDRIHAFGQELHAKRGVTLDSYLFDDGWDNHRTLWQFNNGFPNGFTPIRQAAEMYGADPGVWMSPWGGYGPPKKERIDYGKAAGFEIVSDGYALSGPKYFEHFRDVCLEMIRRYGVNQFKIDGTGNADSVFRGSSFDSDFDAAIHLIGEMREAKPDVFIDLTTGTRPTPFWLLYADSIWRGGEDDGFLGVGSERERWITYRDSDVYARIVKDGPLYPLNSLMLHGIIYAEKQRRLNTDPGHDFRNEVRSYFGTGTQTQEMYITPSLLTPANWDDLAEAAKWSRSNAETLKDTHWVGGDPAWLEVYGWASWSPKKGILVLRNPSDKRQSISLDIAKALELPAGASRSFEARSPWKEDAERPLLRLHAGSPHEFALAPFEVLTLEMEPR